MKREMVTKTALYA